MESSIMDINERKRIAKVFHKLKISELKEELTKLDVKNIKSLRKTELQEKLFDKIQLISSQIKLMTKDETINELKLIDKYRGLVKWNEEDLKDYLKHLYRDIKTFLTYQHRTTNFDIENVKYRSTSSLSSLLTDNNNSKSITISREKFNTMPLFKLQDRFGFKRTEIKRTEMYQICKKRLEKQKTSQIKLKEIIILPVKKHFFIENNNNNNDNNDNDNDDNNRNDKSKSKYKHKSKRRERLKLKNDEFFKQSKHKFLILFNLNTNYRGIIHRFAEKNGLYSESAGGISGNNNNNSNTRNGDDQDNNPISRKIIGISRRCDRTELRKELIKFEKIQQKIASTVKENAARKPTKKNLLQVEKKQEKENANANNNNNNNSNSDLNDNAANVATNDVIENIVKRNPGLSSDPSSSLSSSSSSNSNSEII